MREPERRKRTIGVKWLARECLGEGRSEEGLGLPPNCGEMIVLIVSGRAYALTRSSVRWLASRLRALYAEDESEEGATAHQLAWALEGALEGRDQPLELILAHAAPVLRVVQTAPLQPSPGLIAVQDALRRLQIEAS